MLRRQREIFFRIVEHGDAVPIADLFCRGTCCRAVACHQQELRRHAALPERSTRESKQRPTTLERWTPTWKIATSPRVKPSKLAERALQFASLSHKQLKTYAAQPPRSYKGITSTSPLLMLYCWRSGQLGTDLIRFSSSFVGP